VTLLIFSGNSATFTLNDLILRNGRTTCSNNGPGITNTSDSLLTLNGCIVTGNSSVGNWSNGGGINSEGPLTIFNSTISGNTLTGSGNFVESGGIYAANALDLINSTIAGNSTPGTGGGIYSAGGLLMTDSTIAGNSANDGGGIYSTGGGTNFLYNSIVEGNSTTTNGGYADINGTLTTLPSTLGGMSQSASGTGASNITTGLNALGSYGGLTQTMLPQPGSAAICGGTEYTDAFAPSTSATSPRQTPIVPQERWTSARYRRATPWSSRNNPPPRRPEQPSLQRQPWPSQKIAFPIRQVRHPWSWRRRRPALSMGLPPKQPAAVRQPSATEHLHSAKQ